MIITRLILHNFGVYAGTNTLNFTNDRPVVLIGGMNGRGKTTILNAILISLYGANSFAYKDSTYKSYGQYLTSFVNTNRGNTECAIELEFKLDTRDEDVYSVRRSWDAVHKRVKESIGVKKNYQDDAFLSRNWAVFIESLIPSALSQYFFFDGDNIAELAVGVTDKRMKNSIKALLGISMLDQLESDIKRLKRKKIKSSVSDDEQELSEHLRREMETYASELASIDEEIEKNADNLLKIQKTLEKKKHAYVAKGGYIVEERQGMFSRRNELTVSLQHQKELLVESASTELPLRMVKHLLRSINKNVLIEKEYEELQVTANTLEGILPKLSYNEADHQIIHSFISNIENLAEEKSGELVYNVSSKVVYQLNNLLARSLDTNKQKTEELLILCEKTQKEIDDIDRHLSVDVDEKQIKKLFTQIKKAEQDEIEAEEIVARLQRKRSEANGRYIRATSEFNKSVEKLLSSLESNDENERMIEYIGHVDKILSEYKVRIQSRKINNLTKTITACYRRLANKNNLISKITMDPITLEFVYYNRDKEIVPKSSLSEGEKQMMVISILWALAICSKRKLPVIVDTPLARLDSKHRMALINAYFPHASEQTIILSTDSEIVGEYYNELNKYVSDEFTLLYDDTTKSSSVVKGYFENGYDS